MRMRVEELALQAEVSVDTIRYYQKQGLLLAPDRDGRLAWYTAEHLERIARIKDLQRRGFSLAVIRRFLAGELDPADERLAEAVVAAGDRDAFEEGVGATPGSDGELFDMAELARRAGVPAAVLESLVREGFLAPKVQDGIELFTPGDAEVIAGGLRLVEAGLPLPELIDLARRQHQATRDVAVQAVELFDTYVRKPLRDADLSEEDKATRMVEAFRSVMPAVTALVAQHFRRTLLQVAQEKFEADDERDPLPGDRRGSDG